MEYVLINDIHLSDRPPASCTDTYLDDLFDLLRQAAQLAAERDGAIVLAGDVFHHKAPNRTSHQTVMRLIDWARMALSPVFAVVGNHDIQHDRVGSIHETQPLGVAMASGAIELLDGWHDYHPIYGVPWQMTWDKAHVQDALYEYRHGQFDDNHLVVTHAPLYPPGKELPFEFFPAEQFAEAMGGKGTVHYGHVHEPHGVYTCNGVTFSNCGALSRGSLHEHNLARTPSVAIWDSNTGRMDHLPLQAKPASEVFRLQQAREAKEAALDLSTFLDAVEATQLDVVASGSVLAKLRETVEDKALLAVIEKLMDDAQ